LRNVLRKGSNDRHFDLREKWQSEELPNVYCPPVSVAVRTVIRLAGNVASTKEVETTQEMFSWGNLKISPLGEACTQMAG
jgi:hypothetical protein